MKIHEEKNYKTDVTDSLENWSKYAKAYDPIKCASIDGTDTEPHDRAVIRALNSTYKPNRFVKGRPECTIFVSRLNHETSKDTIKELFSKYGKLKRFRMVKDIVTGMPKGYAFVEFEEEQAAEEAYRIANKMVVDGNIIFVDFECERLLKGWRPRRLGGGFAGKKESGQLRFGGRDRPFKKPIALELKEKEENKLNEKKKRQEEEQRHRRHKRRSPGFENSRHFPLRDRARRESPLRDKAKRSLSTGDKEKNRSPPRKVARLISLSKESSRHQSPPRENAKQHSPPKEQVKPRSPTRIQANSSSRENMKHSTSRKNVSKYPSPTERSKQASPSQKIGKKHTPVRENGDHRSRENIKYVSPPRKNFQSYLHREENMGRYSAPRNEINKQKHHSPVRDPNIGHHSPSQKQFRSNIREQDRRHSPLNRNDPTYSSRGNEYFFPREDERYRSPLQEGSSPRKNERHFSPFRENDRHYFSPREREGGRYRSPVRENRGPISPKTGTNRNSPVRESTKHYSPLREYQQFSTSREIRHQSPHSENYPVSHQHANYPPPFYSEPQSSRHFSPVRESFSPFRDVRHPIHSREVDFPPSRNNAEYFSPPRQNEGQYFHTRENANHYSPGEDFGSHDNFSHEQNSAFPPSQGATQFSQLKSNRGWHLNSTNRGRRFPRQRGNYRGGFRRY